MNNNVNRKKLIIVGAGSSGLITLKTALDTLPDWDVECFESSNSIQGCWGNPHPTFISTSTKYTTQFSCYPIFDANVEPNPEVDKKEFFRAGEYGEYLENFANAFNLKRSIRFFTKVKQLTPINSSNSSDMPEWRVQLIDLKEESGKEWSQIANVIIICTGLAAEAKPLSLSAESCKAQIISDLKDINQIKGKTVVVIGGGESAVDNAVRLAKLDPSSKIFLSLYSGIRVSPRYHPIRGVPSDFLRNRLMLSIDVGLRNWIGEHFVALRISHQRFFERIFPAKIKPNELPLPEANIKKFWTQKLNAAPKDKLFNMFHNKSDEFLDYVATGKIRIIGSPIDQSYQNFREFGSERTCQIQTEVIIPAIGFRSRLAECLSFPLDMTDFYKGCININNPSLFAIGYARPIIGNIPSISEIQARYVCNFIAQGCKFANNVLSQYSREQLIRSNQFSSLDLKALYPVEMFPYCDSLAKELSIYPTLFQQLSRHGIYSGLKRWLSFWLSPATTLNYISQKNGLTKNNNISEDYYSPIYLPYSLIFLLIVLKPIDYLYSFCKKCQ